MNIAFVAATPFQIINSLSIRLHLNDYLPTEYMLSDDRYDIYLIEGFANAHETSKALQRLNFFTNVYLIEKEYDKYAFNIEKAPTLAKDILFLTMNTPSLSNSYDHMFFSLPTLTAHTITKNNPNMKLHLFDDGWGSYINDILTENGWIERLPKELFITYPQIADTKVNEAYKVDKLTIPQDRAFVNILNEVFNYSSPKTKNNSIYLSIPLSETNIDIIPEQQLIHFIKTSNATIKPHPRDDVEELQKHYQDNLFDTRGLSMELLCSNKEITNESLLISTFSTSMYNPKLIFGLSPYLLFLYPLIFKDNTLLECDKIAKNLLTTYAKQENKICIANSWKEAEDFIASIKQN